MQGHQHSLPVLVSGLLDAHILPDNLSTSSKVILSSDASTSANTPHTVNLSAFLPKIGPRGWRSWPESQADTRTGDCVKQNEGKIEKNSGPNGDDEITSIFLLLTGRYKPDASREGRKARRTQRKKKELKAPNFTINKKVSPGTLSDLGSE